MEFTLNTFLAMKLNFIKKFYRESRTPFDTTIQKIKNHESPFDGYNPNPECDEDPFIDEWFDAYYSIETLGSCCLCLVHDTLKQFLEEFITSTGKTVPSGRKGKRESWVFRYEAFFKSEYNIDWNTAPLDMSIMKQITLARNQLQHSGDLMANHIWQNADYKKQFPDTMFVEDVGRSDNKLSIKEEGLFRAIEFVGAFGRFLISSTTATFKIRYVSPLDGFERVDDATAWELLKKEWGDDL